MQRRNQGRFIYGPRGEVGYDAPTWLSQWDIGSPYNPFERKCFVISSLGTIGKMAKQRGTHVQFKLHGTKTIDLTSSPPSGDKSQ